MQALSRALASLHGACSTTGRLAAARSFSGVAAAAWTSAGGSASADHPSSQVAVQREGARSKLFTILAQVWQQAEKEGLKSKRFTKQMLQELKREGWVKTEPMGSFKKQKIHGYRLNPKRQQEREARLEKQAAAAGRKSGQAVAAKNQ